MIMRTILRRLSYNKLLVLGFASIITLGALLLMLPVSTRDGSSTGAINAFFTATSATCVTGLSVYDTYSHWSVFGQAVILTMIQVGGLGFMTFICMLSIIVHRKMSLSERRFLVQSYGQMHLQGIRQTLRNILIGTAAFESCGAIILSIRFCPKMGLAEGIGNAVFHSVSAFCNAGFDLMGKYGKFSSLIAFADDKAVLLTIASLIIIGGIGFPIWIDLVHNGIKFKSYELHSKVVLTTTAILIVLGTVFFYLTEYTGVFAHMSIGDRLCAAFFQAITPRTAGFSAIDQSALSDSGTVMTVLYMLIGGSPASTAGGIKTTTIAVVLLGTAASVRNNEGIYIFKKRLDNRMITQACSILTIYCFAVLVSGIALSLIEGLPYKSIIYEVVSAVGTVGLSTGITPGLSAASRVIILLLMFFGRIGGLSLIMAMAERRKPVPLERPTEKILLG